MICLCDRVLHSGAGTSVVIGAADDLRAAEFREVGGEIRIGISQSLGGFHEREFGSGNLRAGPIDRVTAGVLVTGDVRPAHLGGRTRRKADTQDE